MEKIRTEQQRRNAQIGIMVPQNDAFDTWFDIEARYSAWLWLSCLLTFVSVPVFLLEFVVLIVQAIRHHARQRDESG
jgi:hypothetical protein